MSAEEIIQKVFDGTNGIGVTVVTGGTASASGATSFEEILQKIFDSTNSCLFVE